MQAHVTAAITMFVTECLYQSVYTVMTWKRLGKGDVSVAMCIIRTVGSVISVVMLILACILSLLLLVEFPNPAVVSFLCSKLNSSYCPK